MQNQLGCPMKWLLENLPLISHQFIKVTAKPKKKMPKTILFTQTKFKCKNPMHQIPQKCF